MWLLACFPCDVHCNGTLLDFICRWITPVLLLIDFYEKMAVSSKRRAQMNKVCARWLNKGDYVFLFWNKNCSNILSLQYLQPNGNNWRWFDDRSGRWCSYSASNNSTIDSAWRAGETSVRFTAGRRRYTVQFNTMVQVGDTSWSSTQPWDLSSYFIVCKLFKTCT